MGKQRVLLILKMAGRRSFATLRTAVLALIAVALAATVAACVSAHGRAVERGATASFGSYFQQVTGNAAVQSYMEKLGSSGRAVALSRTRANLLSAQTQSATVADVTMTSGPANIGVLRQGSYPARPGDISISVEAARQLHLSVGDVLQLIDTQAAEGDKTGTAAEFRVSGVTENPASIRELSAVALTDSSDVLGQADVWLTNESLAPIEVELTRGGGQATTAAVTSARMGAYTLSNQTIPPQLAWFIGLVMLSVVIVALYGSGRSRRREIYRILLSLGDTRWKASATTCASATVTALAGGILGWVSAAAVHVSFAGVLGEYVEQRWEEPEWGAINSTAVAVLLLMLIGGVLAAGATVFFEAHRHRSKLHGEIFSRRLLLGIGIIGTVLTVAFVAARQLYIFPYGHYAAMIAGALSIPSLAHALQPGSRRYPVTARLAQRMQKMALLGMAVVFVLSYYASLYASSVAVLSNWTSRQVSGETSYLSITGANKNAVDNLMQRYPEISERTAIFGDVATHDRMYRIVDSAGAPCIKSASDLGDCPTVALDLVMVASGGLLDRGYVNHAPASFVSESGATTLLGIALSDGQVTGTFTADGLIADERLENNVLSGLILPPDSPLLTQLGVGEPYSYTVIIFGFGSLSDEVRDGIRSTVLLEAPFAFLVDPDEPGIRQLKAQAVVRQLLALLVAPIVLLATVTAVVSEQTTERRLIELGGGGNRARWRLVAPLITSYVLSLGSGVVFGRLAAMDRLPFTYSPVTHDYGWLWALTLVGLLAVLPALRLGIRPFVENVNRR